MSRDKREEITGKEDSVIQTEKNNRRCIYAVAMYLLLFLLCLGFYLICMAAEQVYPFGSRSFLYQDAYDQYTGILEIFLDWLKSGEKGTFLWERGFGMDMILNLFYYCMSPFCIIAVVLGAGRVELSMTIMILLKASCLAPAAFYYFRHSNIHRFTEKTVSSGFVTGISIVFSMTYALCGYVLAYNHNVIWLDGLILLPFIAIAVEKMAEGKWRIRYTLLLAAAFFVNYYFAFYICLFIVFYFFFQEWKDGKTLLRGGGRFLLWSIVAVCIAGVVIVPSIYAILHLSSSGNSDYALPWYQIGNLGSFVNSFYPMQDITTGSLFNHNNYCGTFAVLLAVLFLFLKKPSRKLRIKYLVMVLFLAACLNNAGLNYVFHGFSIPHGLGNRFAFILLFFILIAAYICLLNAKNFTYKQVLFSFGVGLAAFLLELFLNKESSNPYSYVAVMLFAVAYLGLFIFALRKSIQWNTFYIWVIGLWMIEVVLNGYVAVPQKINEERLADAMNQQAWSREYNELELEAGERKTVLVKYDYMPLSYTNCYSSMANGSTIDLFESLGLSHYQNIEYTYRRTTPVTALLFNVRYVWTDEKNAVGGYHEVLEKDGYYLYEADALAGMGYMLDADILNWNADGSPAENQNALVSSGTGGVVNDSLFEAVVIPDDAITIMGMDVTEQETEETDDAEQENAEPKNGETEDEKLKTGTSKKRVYEYTCKSDVGVFVNIKYTAEAQGDIYLEGADTKLQGVEAFINEEPVVTTNYVESSGIVHIGQVEPGDAVLIRLYTGAGSNETGTKSFALYTMNREVSDAFADYLAQNEMAFDGYEGNQMKGHITAKTDGVLCLAVPYQEGFTAVVDGVEYKPIKLGTGLTGIQITKGEHQIVLSYHTPLLWLGAVLSLAGCLLLIGFGLFQKKRLC